MKDTELLLCDGREAVKLALEAMEPGFDFTLTWGFARDELSGDRVVWGEYANLSTEVAVVDAISYQVTVHGSDLDRLRQLTAAVNTALLGLGLKREYASPDQFDEGYYTKTFRFGRRVDKRTMRLID